MRIAIALFVATLTAIPALACAQAQTGVTTSRVTVRLNDLDLGTRGGARTAIRRLSRAAREACGADPTAPSDLIVLSDAFQRCRADALAAALDRAPALAVVAGEGPD